MSIAAANGGGNGAAAPAAQGEAKVLRGPAAMLAKAMDESREVPTATSFRTIAVDTLDAKRKALNAVLNERGMKVSFTHIVAWAIAQAAKDFPVMVRLFDERDGKPVAIEGSPVNLGIAVDVERKDGSHSLMVPAIKGAGGLDFAGFHSYYEDLINKTRENKLTADDFQGTNISLTNPGGIGTVASVPRLMKGQSAIIATGSIAYPPEWAHAAPDRLRAARRLQGDDADLDLRPPGDPGRRVGRLPAPDRAAAPGRGLLLRGDRDRPRGRGGADRRRPPRLGLRSAAGRRRRRPRPRPRPTKSCCRRSRRRPPCSRGTAPTAISPPASTRSAASPRATPRSSPRTST